MLAKAGGQTPALPLRHRAVSLEIAGSRKTRQNFIKFCKFVLGQTVALDYLATRPHFLFYHIFQQKSRLKNSGIFSVVSPIFAEFRHSRATLRGRK